MLPGSIIPHHAVTLLRPAAADTSLSPILPATPPPLQVAPGLVKRQKQHFVALPDIGVELILGVNGNVWVAPYMQRREDGSLPDPLPAFDVEARRAVCRAAGAVRALAQLYLMVYPAAIVDTYELSVAQQVEVQDMAEGAFLAVLIDSEIARRDKAAAADRL
jgi:hypothetical protein